MATAEANLGREQARRWVWPLLALVLGVGLALRLWGVKQGLPFAYNADEADHFVPHAVAMFEESTLNPHYFANPPAFTYVLHFLYALRYGGAQAVQHAYAAHPGSLYELARIAAALLGTLALWLLYLLGARLFNRAVGLLAAAVQAVAFLPVFYAHLALNDVPTLAPATATLLGAAGVLRKGRARDHLLAGVGLGLACATKYTAGIVLVPYLAAVVCRCLEDRRRTARSEGLGVARMEGSDPGESDGSDPGQSGGSSSTRLRRGRYSRTNGLGTSRSGILLAIGGLALAGLAAAAFFFIANPYSVLDYSSFHDALVHQSAVSSESQGKLGAPKHGGILYYLWALTWGLGWVPALAALGGALAVWRVERRLGWLLVPGPLLFLAFMGTQSRYFGRWLMPIFPILCLLGAFFALYLAAALGGALGARRARDAGGENGAAGAGQAGTSEGARDAARARTVDDAGVTHDGHHRGTPRAGLRSPLAIVLTTLILISILAQGLVYSVHSGLTLARADTRTLTRQWMIANIPRGAKVVVEPVSPDQWAFGPPGTRACPHYPRYLWCKYASLFTRVSPSGALDEAGKHQVGIEDYERTLAPALIDYYQANGYCWVITGSTEYGRAQADPAAVPHAIPYYRALARAGEVVYRASPYRPGKGPVAFNFDWSFDYYPLAYERPGPAMTVYRLHGGRCRT